MTSLEGWSSTIELRPQRAEDIPIYSSIRRYAQPGIRNTLNLELSPPRGCAANKHWGNVGEAGGKNLSNLRVIFVLVLSEAVLVLRTRQEPTPACGHPSAREDFEDDDEDDCGRIARLGLKL